MSFNKLKIAFIIIFFLAIYYCFHYGKEIIYKLSYKTRDTDGKLFNGKKEGEWKTYYLTGQLKDWEHYKHDTLNGKSISYYPNGNLSSKATYKMGIKVDSFNMYNDNGQVNLQEWYDSTGKSQGVFKVYYENGQLSQIGKNKNGHLDDTSKVYYENGLLKGIEIYKDNNKIGNWIYFDVNGKQIKKELYMNDSLIMTTN